MRKVSLLGGAGKLTKKKKEKIESLQSLYGKAIRDNVGKPYIYTKKCVWATYFHVFEERHHMCPMTSVILSL